jgi:hypothetical protein
VRELKNREEDDGVSVVSRARGSRPTDYGGYPNCHQAWRWNIGFPNDLPRLDTDAEIVASGRRGMTSDGWTDDVAGRAAPEPAARGGGVGAMLAEIGLWSGSHTANYPDVVAFVDAEADDEGRRAIADRLDGGRRTDRAYMGYATCTICGCRNGSGELTDGVFIWPEGLGHYVRLHRVRLPAELERALRLPMTADEQALERATMAGNDARNREYWRRLTGVSSPEEPNG